MEVVVAESNVLNPELFQAVSYINQANEKVLELLNEPWFTEDSLQEEVGLLRSKIKILVTDISDITDLIISNTGNTSKQLSDFFIRKSNYLINLLNRLEPLVKVFEKENSQLPRLMRITKERTQLISSTTLELRDVVNEINLRFEYFYEINLQLNNSKNEFIDLINIDLANLYKEFINKNKENLGYLETGINSSQENLIEIDKQIKNNIDAIKENFQEALKQQTEIQNLSRIITNEIESNKLLIKNESETQIKATLNDVDAFAEEVKGHMATSFENFTISQTEQRSNLKEVIDNTEKTHADFIRIVEKAGIYELTLNYNKKAEEEKQEYKDYRKFTAWSILAAIGTTIIIFLAPVIETWITDQKLDMNYFTLFARLTISIMFFVLALYTSKQAAKHYECYQENHRTYLQLAALEPFISRMDDADKLAIRKELISVYFSSPSDGKFAAKSDEVDLPANINSVIHKLIDTVKGSKEESKPEA